MSERFFEEVCYSLEITLGHRPIIQSQIVSVVDEKIMRKET